MEVLLHRCSIALRSRRCRWALVKLLQQEKKQEKKQEQKQVNDVKTTMTTTTTTTTTMTHNHFQPPMVVHNATILPTSILSGPVKTDRAQSNDPVKTDRAQSNGPVKSYGSPVSLRLFPLHISTFEALSRLQVSGVMTHD